MNASCLKVTINGKKYLITGIREEVSRKDLLCALAKSTDENATVQLKQEFAVATQRQGHNEQLNSSKNEVNLLALLKGERATAGDLKSLNVLNSLGKDAKIIKRNSFTLDCTSESSCKSRKRSKRYSREIKHVINTDEILNKQVEKSRTLRKTSTKKTLKPSKPITAKKHRSVDDSDIDSYTKGSLARRIKKRPKRCYDDSDIAIYHSLFHIVLDQTVRLHKTHKQSKDFIKNMSWTEEIKNDYQLYYIDDDHSDEINASTISVNVCGNDVDNDSGLPSPEYDSSESQEIQPMRIKKTISDALLQKDKYLIRDKIVEKDIKTSYIVNKHDNCYSDNKSSQTNVLDKETCTLQNTDYCCCEKGEKKCNSIKRSKSINNKLSPRELNKNSKLTRSQSLGDLLRDSNGGDPTSMCAHSSLREIDIANTLRSGSLAEENIKSLLDNSTCSGRKALKVMGVMNESSVIHNTIKEKSKKKQGKKKISKSDISDPQLLSPTRFRRYGSLKSVQSALKKDKMVAINSESIGRAVALPAGDKEEERKDKEKFYNKKLKEIRSKRSKSPKSIRPASELKGKLKDKQSDKCSDDNKSNHETQDACNSTRGCGDKETVKRDIKDKMGTTVRCEDSTDRISVTVAGTTCDESDDFSVNKNSSHSCDCARTKNEIDIGNIEKHINELNELKGARSDLLDSGKHTCFCSRDTSPSRKLERSRSETSESPDRSAARSDDGCERGDKFDASDQLENTSDYSSLNENIKLDFDEIDMEKIDREELISLYAKEEEDLFELLEKILDYNLMIAVLSEELEIVMTETNSNETLDDLIAEEESVYREISNVRSLLTAVTDLCSYQRKEMSDNLALLDKLDSKVRTKKAGYDILKSGEWRTNLNHAPRSLVKHSKEKIKTARRNASSANV